MCSNTSLSSGGCGGDNDRHGGSVGDSIYLKKLKRQRVPKRGPGVAELEKILREQGKRSDLDSVKNDGLSLVSSNSLPRSVSFAPKPNPPPLGGSNNGGKSGVHVPGSGVFLQEHALLPTMWEFREPHIDKLDPTFQFPVLLSNGSNKNLFSSPSNLMQTSQHSLPLEKMSSSSTTPSAGPCYGREPPSNQTSYHHSTLWPEEERMVGEKRPRPFPLEIPPVPTFRYQIPTFSTEMNRLDLPFSFGNCTVNFEKKDIISRELRSSSSLDQQSIKKFNIDNGAPCSNFLHFPSPATPQREGPRFNPFSLQENNGQSQQRPTQSGSIQKKPFYSFLVPREQLESLNNERVETRGDNGIDLNLKL